MSDDDILKLVSEHTSFDVQADYPGILMNDYGHMVSKDKFISLARAIAAKEREECANLCLAQQEMEPQVIERHKISFSPSNIMAQRCAFVILARGNL